MKNWLALSLLAAIAIISSCSTAEVGRYSRETTFGVISSINPNNRVLFQILTDNDGMFDVVSYGTPSHGVYVGERVYFDYEVWDDNTRNTKVKVRGFHSIISKPLDILSQSDEDILGSDPIRCSASFGGNYININYEYITLGGNDHAISLVYDDTTPDDGYADLYLRHNGGGEKGTPASGTSVIGVASFPISELIPNDDYKVEIRLHWTWWDSATGDLKEESATATFIPFVDSRII